MSSQIADPTFFRVIHESITLMFSFTPDKYVASSDWGLSIFTIHAIVGLFMTIVVFARFLSLLPPPKTKDDFET